MSYDDMVDSKLKLTIVFQVSIETVIGSKQTMIFKERWRDLTVSKILLDNKIYLEQLFFRNYWLN